MLKRGLCFMIAAVMLVSGLLPASRQAVAASAQTAGDWQGHWAQEEIGRWLDSGLLEGYPDGSFRPQQSLTRAEFAVVLTRLFGLRAEAAPVFADIKPGEWHAEAIDALTRAGLAEGYPDGTFQPSRSVTRQEAAVLLYRAFLFKEEDAPTGGTSSYKDQEAIGSFASEAVRQLGGRGVLLGYPDGSFRPQEPLTRASAAAMLHRLTGSWMHSADDMAQGRIQGHVLVAAGNTKVEDANVEGNVYVTAGSASGDLSIIRTIVEGMIHFQGAQDILLKDTVARAAVIHRSGTAIKAEGTTKMGHIRFAAGGSWDHSGADTGGAVQIMTSESVQLKGNYESVTITASSNVRIEGAVDAIRVDSSMAYVNGVELKRGQTYTLSNGQLVEAGEAAPPPTPPATGPVIPGPNPNPNNPGEPQLWTLVWSDEFDGSGERLNEHGVDLGKWGFQNGTGSQYGLDGWGNNEQQYYTEDNVRVQDGRLVIEARNDGRGGKPYTSGRLYTAPTFSKAYGKFEARIKMPTGQGFWPAFWMMPQDSEYGVWASSGEIDIMEARGRQPDHVGGTIHYGGVWPGNKYMGREYYFPQGQSIAEYHTYALEWEPGELRWYVDGQLYSTLNNWDSQGQDQPTRYAYPAPFDKPFYMILNLAVGGTYDGNREPEPSMFPAQMEVDYVRVYELTGRPYREAVQPIVDKEELPPGAKLPVDGNYIYDSGYDRPITTVTKDSDTLHPQDWNFVALDTFGGRGSVAIEETGGSRFARVDIAEGGSQVHSVQLIQHLTLTKGRYYRVSYDAKAASDRTLTVKLGGGAERGYAAYSDSKTIQLHSDVASHTFAFQMLADSDARARLEFNMGTNASSVWIGHVKVEEIEGIPLDEDGEKPPLADGNHVYNGSFNLGEMHRMTYWHFDVQPDAVATARVDSRENRLRVTVAGGGAALSAVALTQRGIELLRGEDYTLSFQAKAAEADRTVGVSLGSSDGTRAYLERDILVGRNEDSYEVRFTMPAEVTDRQAVLHFHLGGQAGAVELDDITLIRTSDRNIDYSGIDFFPLRNGGFNAGFASWDPFTEGGAASFEAAGGEAEIAIAAKGPNPWSVMLSQGGLKLSKGFEYRLAFDVRSSEARDMEAVVENASYTRHFQTHSIAVSPQVRRYEYSFKMNADETVALKFLLGNTSTSPAGSHTVYIDNVVLELKDPPVKRAPELQAAPEMRVGQAAVLRYVEDEAWRSAVTAVSVDGSRVADTDYRLEPGQLHLAASLFPAAKSYIVTVEAQGYAPAVVSQPYYAADGNLLMNGSFTAGQANWDYWVGEGGVSALSIAGEEAAIDITNHGGIHSQWGVPLSWSTQLSQSGIQLAAGRTYELSFRARSTIERPIEVELGGLPGQPKHVMQVNKEAGVYTERFSTAGAVQLKLLFLLGNVVHGGQTTPDAAHTVYLDDIVIREVDQQP
ncbi:carbohydrate binding domain-containing protein [Paenibacillus daejeonensis]|uniref:carbohydrate binding domain-containing protein n=1 Tax=Paenibacillus daejeonensis TaxID=135193 RepID=UPI0003622B8D|nr:carbohydrate binding domain-containing protein [Paenibacillus daejeonensis]